MMTVWIVAGPPGSGKSSWLERHASANDIIISRDKIRFSLLKDEDDYFAYEDKVYNLFIKTIQEAINKEKYDNIYIDATHLTPKSRKQLIKQLIFDKNKVILKAISFEIDLETCIERNAKRTGRAYVPETALRNMYNSYKIPMLWEGFFIEIIHITKENENE